MTPGKIEGATATLGAPDGWDAGKFGECEPLQVREAECPETGSYGWQSAWYPNEEEKAAIAAGAPVVLTVWGKGHPPVGLHVEPQATAGQVSS